MDTALLSLWFVCALGAAVFAAAAPVTRTTAVVVAVAFVLGAWWIRQPFAPATPAVGIAAALMAAREVVRSPGGASVSAMAGLLAGAWSGLLVFQGMPSMAALPVAVSLPAISAWLRLRRPGFAPPRLREEALLVMVVLGLSMAALPGISEGWHAAVNLSVQGRPADPGPSAAMPGWTLIVASAALVCGGLFSLWSRR